MFIDVASDFNNNDRNQTFFGQIFKDVSLTFSALVPSLAFASNDKSTSHIHDVVQILWPLAEIWNRDLEFS
jgi:hypothetical protein